MKASELRIGNYIFRTNKLTKETSLHELTASCILDISANGEMSSFIYEPIPITQEWLLNFEFKKTKSDFFKKRRLVLLKSPVNNSNYYVYVNKKLTVIIAYVHQLQNLYFTLKVDELILKTTIDTTDYGGF